MRAERRVILDRDDFDATSERFDSKVDRSGECHVWTGTKNQSGYGWFHVRGSGSAPGRVSCLAHVYAWQRVNGDIPDEMQLDHLCRNRACCRLEHIELVSQRENVIRGNTFGARAHKTGRCIRGHDDWAYHAAPYMQSKHGRWRWCRSCKHEADRQRKDYRHALHGRLVLEARRQIAIFHGVTYLTPEAREEELALEGLG